jgi:pantothenate kinase-related protein Tda10
MFLFHLKFLCLGSGKSYLAKGLRDVEVINGGNAPRIHSIDDYFMTEVEKVRLQFVPT